MSPEPGPATEPPGERPADRPVGEAIIWSAAGSLVSGPLVLGGLGMALDHWLGTGRMFTALGAVLGAVTGFYIVYVRFGRDESSQ